jgi:hypothetical protein
LWDGIDIFLEELPMADSATDIAPLHKLYPGGFEGPTGYEHSVRADFCMNDISGEHYFEIDVLNNEVGGQVTRFK